MDFVKGLKGLAKTIVSNENTAKTLGSGSLDVFATPAMIALMEEAAVNSLRLENGETSVGTLINIKHTAATPIGMKVRAEAELIEFEGRKLIFRVTAFDEVETIGEGEHERFIVNAEKFQSKTLNKLNR